jgi:hypothetical protein
LLLVDELSAFAGVVPEALSEAVMPSLAVALLSAFCFCCVLFRSAWLPLFVFLIDDFSFVAARPSLAMGLFEIAAFWICEALAGAVLLLFLLLTFIVSETATALPG